MADIQINSTQTDRTDTMLAILAPNIAQAIKSADDFSVWQAQETAKENNQDIDKAEKAQLEFNHFAKLKGVYDLMGTEILGIKIPFLNAMTAAAKGDVDKQYGRAYNKLKVALGQADELGRIGDRNKAYTTPTLNPETGLLEFDPNAYANLLAGFDRAGTDPTVAQAKIDQLATERAANEELLKLWNSGQIPEDFKRLGKTPIETAQTFSNAQGAAAINAFMGKQSEQQKRQKEGPQFKNDPSLSPAQQTANTLAERGQQPIKEADTTIQSPLEAQPKRAQTENLAQAQNRTIQGIQKDNEPLPPAAAPTKAQKVAVTSTGASVVGQNFTPAPNFSMATPEQLAAIRRRQFK